MGTTKGMLEVVKYSGPVQVHLSRQLINILDQVNVHTPVRSLSTQVPFDQKDIITHRRICVRVHQLLDAQLNALADMLYMDAAAADTLEQHTQCRYVFAELHAAGLALTTEPFFRSLLLAVHAHTIG
jgi:hypothetical protein